MRKLTRLIRSFLYLAPIICFLMAILFLSDPTLARPTKSSRISLLLATGLPGSVDYQVGLGLASLWTTRLKNLGIRVSAAISEGSRENIEAIRISDADLIMVDEFFCFSAYNGQGPYLQRPETRLRAVTCLWSDVMHLLVRSDSLRTGTLQDLDGLTIATGLPDGSSKYILEQLLREMTTPKPEVKVRSVSNVAALDAWKSGTVQALGFSGGLPIPTVNFLIQQNPGQVGFLEIPENDTLSLSREAMPTVFPMSIPAGTYPGQDASVRTFGQNNILVTSSQIDKQVIYELTKTLYASIDYMTKIHPACAQLSLDRAFSSLKIPLHPGAVQYYRERNLRVPDELCAD